MIAWMDLETTGLDPAKGVILEVAVVVTHDDLSTYCEFHTTVDPGKPLDGMMDEHVRAMHTDNGLLDELDGSPFLAEVDAQVARLVDQPEKMPLAGSTISFDRAWINALMPLTAAALHYRNIDVSTLRELCGRWRPRLNDFRPVGKKKHRALSDIRESIELLRFYRETWLR